MLLQEAFDDCGLTVQSFKRDMGFAHSTICGWAAGTSRANPKIFNIMEKRGKFLSTVTLARHDLDWVCETFGIKEAVIAEKLGISKQALHKQKAQGFPPQRRKEIEKILQGIGRRLMTLAKKAA